jgi:hypothetical protein
MEVKMKKIVHIVFALIGIICEGYIVISAINLIEMGKTEIDPEKTYFLISEDNTFRDLPYMLGNKISLLADDSKVPVARMGGFCRGFDQFHYSKGYLCYKKTYASSLLISTMFIDRDRLYVCSLSPEKITKEIENVDSYILDGEKLIYKDIKGNLYYYNIETEEKQKIEWKWSDKWDTPIDNIRWKNKESFYVVDDSRKQLYCYSVKNNKAVKVVQVKEKILGIIPKEEDVLLYLSSGEIIEYCIAEQKAEVLVSGIDASICSESPVYGQKINENLFGCLFTIGEDGRMYYDNYLKLYAYDFQKKTVEEIINFSDMEKYRTEEELEDDPYYYSYSYVIGKERIILNQNETGKGEYIRYYDFVGNLKRKELIRYSQWDTNEYARYFAH